MYAARPLPSDQSCAMSKSDLSLRSHGLATTGFGGSLCRRGLDAIGLVQCLTHAIRLEPGSAMPWHHQRS